MSVSTPLLDNTIEPDDSEDAKNLASKPQSAKQPVVLSPTNRTSGSGAMATSQSDAESGTFVLVSLCPIFNTAQIIRDSRDTPALCASICSILSIFLPNGRCSGVYSVRLVHRQLCVIGMYIIYPSWPPEELGIDSHSRCPSRNGLLELQGTLQAILKGSNSTLPKNVAGRILVGLRFWNQVCYARSIRHAIHNPFPRSTRTARAAGCLKAVM